MEQTTTAVHMILSRIRIPPHLLRLRPFRRHSLVLLVLGIIYVLIGLAYVLTPTPPEREKALTIALHIASLHGWGMVFMTVGACAVISSRWPVMSETWGYTVLSFLSALWGMFYFWGVIYGAPLGTISGVLVWGGLAFLWWAVSGLRNPLPKKQDLSNKGS